VKPDEIARIDIDATALTAGMERISVAAGAADRLDPIVINFSARRSVAIAALAGGLTPRHLEPSWLEPNRSALAALVDKTRLRESRPLTVDLLRGINRGIDLPGLIRQVGVGRLWSARGALREAYAKVDEAGGASPSWRRLLRRSRSAPAAASSIAALTSFLRALGASRGSFDMVRARFGELEFRFAAEVTFVLKNGQRWSGAQTIPLGAAGRPLTETAGLVATKLRDEGQAAGYGPAAAAITELLDRAPGEVRARALAEAVCLRG
jgi:hypothetical protein